MPPSVSYHAMAVAFRQMGLRYSTVTVPLSPSDIYFSSGGTIYDSATSGTSIGTLTATDADSSSWTWTIVTQPSGLTFALSGSNPAGSIDINYSSGTLTAGTKTVRIRADDGTSTPYEEDLTVTVLDSGSDAALMTLTLTGDSSGAKTNEPFEVMVPMAAGAIASGSGRTLRVYDDNGSGAKGTVLSNFQVALPSTDLSGDTRLVALSGIVPALASGGTRKLFVETTTTAAPTGTAITASDVLGTSFAQTIEFDIAGTTYTFDVAAALAASSTFSKTDYQLVSIESGPTRSRWLASGPPKNSGTAHASGDGLRCAVEIVAWKAGTAAVGGGNPITLVECKIEVMNEDAVRASPAHYFYGLTIKRATSLSDSTLISTDLTDVDGNVTRFAYARDATPTGTLTATGGTSLGNNTWTRSTGTFATDCVGAHIRCGGGGAVIKTRNSATSVDVYVYQAASGTSFSSGSWSIEGIGHHYATRFMRKLAIGTARTSLVQWGDGSSAITPTTRAAMDALAASKVFINNDLPFASVTHSTTQLDAMRASDGTIRPLSFRGPNGAVTMGEVETHIGAAGGRIDIGVVPGWAVEGLVKCTAAGRRRVFENAHYFATWQFMLPVRLSGSPANGKLGVMPRLDDDNWTWNPAQAGTAMAAPATVWWPYDSDSAHMPLPFYFAYLMSGDLYWLRCMQRQEACSHLDVNAIYNGAGVNGTVYGDPTGAVATPGGQHQSRGKAWCCAALAHAYIATPDALSDLVAIPKSYFAARLAKTWGALLYWGPDDHAALRTGASETPQWLKEQGHSEHPTYMSSCYIEATWQLYMNMIVIGHAKELGAVDSDGDVGYAWLVGAIKEIQAANAEVRDYLSGSFWHIIYDDSIFTTQPSGWPEIYRRNALLSPIDQSGSIAGPRRTASGTVTLSAASVGTGRTCTFSTAYFTNGGSWYVGGFIYDLASGGVFKITSVGSGTVVTGDVLTAFGGTSLTASNVRLPGPHHDDYASNYAAIPTQDYVQKLVTAARIAADHGILVTEMEAAITTQTARSGYGEADGNMRVARRT